MWHRAQDCVASANDDFSPTETTAVQVQVLTATEVLVLVSLILTSLRIVEQFLSHMTSVVVVLLVMCCYLSTLQRAIAQ